MPSGSPVRSHTCAREIVEFVQGARRSPCRRQYRAVSRRARRARRDPSDRSDHVANRRAAARDRSASGRAAGAPRSACVGRQPLVDRRRRTRRPTRGTSRGRRSSTSRDPQSIDLSGHRPRLHRPCQHRRPHEAMLHGRRPSAGIAARTNPLVHFARQAVTPDRRRVAAVRIAHVSLCNSTSERPAENARDTVPLAWHGSCHLQ